MALNKDFRSKTGNGSVNGEGRAIATPTGELHPQHRYLSLPPSIFIYFCLALLLCPSLCKMCHLLFCISHYTWPVMNIQKAVNAVVIVLFVYVSLCMSQVVMISVNLTHGEFTGPTHLCSPGYVLLPPVSVLHLWVVTLRITTVTRISTPTVWFLLSLL